MRRIGVLAIGALAFASGAAQAQRVVYVVRHAEKAAVGTDPALSEIGAARARALALVLKDAKVDAIYVSNTRRSRETASPLAAQMGITPVEVAGGDPASTYAKALADHPEGVVLIVGHSNTVGPLVKAWADDSSVVVGEDAFDRLFVVVPLGPHRATVAPLRYGP